jgi:3-phosphoglycerate kinase
MAEHIILDDQRIRDILITIENRISEQKYIISQSKKLLSHTGRQMTPACAQKARTLALREQAILKLVGDLLRQKGTGSIMLSTFGHTGLDKLLYVTRRDNKGG